MIPEDWEAESLGKLLSQKPSYGINAPAVAYDDRLPRYLRITDIAEDGTFSASSAVSVSHPLADRYYLEAGDVVFARTGASTGKSYRYREADGRLVYAGFLIRVTPDPKRLNSTYLAAHVRTRNFDKYVAEVSQRSGQPGINSKQLSDFELAVPPTVTEQAAIAEALSDVDEAIAAQEAVIAKKRALKTATMQALLSGTRRLPGFSGKWEVKALGQCLKVRHGKSQAAVESVNGKYPILATGGEIGRADAYLHPGPSVLIGRKGTIDRPQYSGGPFWSIDTLFYTQVDASADAKFLFYKFQMIDWRTYNEASGVPSLSSTTIETIEVQMPKRDEQTAIAAVISDFDLDLEQHEAKLAKLQNLKTGMMQQLLTGKIRLCE